MMAHRDSGARPCGFPPSLATMGADLWGVSDGYVDSGNVWHETAPDVRNRVRASLGADDGNPLDDAVRVVRPGDPLAGLLRLEDGTELLVDGFAPPDLPDGYHTLVTPGDNKASLVLAPPPSCFFPEGVRTWGFAVQLYAMRSRASWGIGDLADLADLARWSTGRYAAGLTMVSPLHAAAPTLPQQPSPYFPSSRVFRNPIYLRIERVPGYGDVAEDIADLADRARELNVGRRIDRDGVWLAKREALRRIWAHWRLRGDPAFDAYVVSHGRPLQRFATYCAIAEAHGSDWRAWPSVWRDADGPAIAAVAAERSDRVRFHAWLQWLLDGQLRDAAQAGPIVTDLAVGVDRAGADAWIWQDRYCLDMAVGAPPDTFNTRGQDWGLPPYHPWRLRSGGYDAFIATVRSAFRHAAGVRIDHVMGLFRLWCIPEGCAPTDGCYVYLPFAEYLAIVAIESARAGAFVIGEDLGTVEPYVREELQSQRILSYRLLQFEDGPAAKLPALAVAAVTTHDLPTIAGLWTGADLAAQTTIALHPNVDATASTRSILGARAGVSDDASVAAVVEGVHRDLATAACAIVTATLDDALGVVERPNMPGTIDEWPNWRIALPEPLELILSDPRVEAVAVTLRDR